MKKYSILSLIVFLLFVFPGCEDFLEEKPLGFASYANLTNSEQGLQQLLNGVYNPGTNFWRERYQMPYGWPGDDVFKGTDNNAERNALDDYLWTTTNGSVSQKWDGPYQSITRANMLLEGIEDFEDGDFKEKTIAEAKFLRGMFYFLLVRTFGGVPLITTYENAELFPSRASIPEVYEQIISDLQDAEQVLPGRNELPPSEIGRATRGAAKAFLGEVYLTMATTPETADPNYFNLAAAKLKEVIDTEGYGLIDNYKEAFEPQNAGGEEDVFSIYFKANTPSPLNGYIHARMSPNPDVYGNRGFGRGAVMPYVYEMFEDEDERKATIIRGEYTVSNFDASGALISTETHTTPNDYPYAQKYLDPNTGRFSHNQTDAIWPLIRYADVLLMYSEAINESQGPSADAYMGIDMVRERANASEIPRGLGQDELRQYIRDERLLELHAEAHRWFDLKRWNILEERIKEVKPWAQVQSKHRFFPIPQSEMDVNPNLEQNPGYGG
jgi:hypothetical protein